MMRRSLYLSLLVLALTSAPAWGQMAICYNCPPEWANWKGQLESIKKATAITVPGDNKNSGQALTQLLAERNKPVADMAYFGITVGIKAAEEGVITGYRPSHFDEIPTDLKDPQGRWWTIHSGTLVLMVNKDALGKSPAPQSWVDLLKTDYSGKVGYLDPTSAFVGYAGAIAINQALGGSLDNFDPAVRFLKDLQKNQPIIPKQTAYARVLSGEIPIMIDYDFNAYRMKYTDKGNIEVVIPKEGTLIMPYVMGLVTNGPNAAHGKRVLDHLLSDEGQRVWADAYVRPIRARAMSSERAKEFLPAADYARAKAIDYKKMAERQDAFVKRYLAEVAAQ